MPHQAGNSRCDQRTGRHLTAGQLGGGADRQFAALGRKHGRIIGDDQTSRTGLLLRGRAADDPSNCMKSHRVTTALDLAPSNRRRLPELRAPRRRTFTVPEVAQILGVGRSTAYALVRSGEIRALRFGAARRHAYRGRSHARRRSNRVITFRRVGSLCRGGRNATLRCSQIGSKRAPACGRLPCHITAPRRPTSPRPRATAWSAVAYACA